jgi:hypothetical protein
VASSFGVGEVRSIKSQSHRHSNGSLRVRRDPVEASQAESRQLSPNRALYERLRRLLRSTSD